MASVRLLRNLARCDSCGDTIESTHRHDFVTCSCGGLSVDGGLAYARRCFRSEEWTDLSEYEKRPCSHGDDCDVPWSLHDWSYEELIEKASSALRWWTKEEHDAECTNGGCPGFDYHKATKDTR